MFGWVWVWCILMSGGWCGGFRFILKFWKFVSYLMFLSCFCVCWLILWVFMLNLSSMIWFSFIWLRFMILCGSLDSCLIWWLFCLILFVFVSWVVGWGWFWFLLRKCCVMLRWLFCFVIWRVFCFIFFSCCLILIVC